MSSSGGARPELGPWLSAPRTAGVFTDFDGTISAIVEDYGDAVPLPGAAATLARLVDRYAKVAVISGRPAAYLAQHFAGAGATELVGLYGMETAVVSSGGPETRTRPDVERWRDVVGVAAGAAEKSAPPGLVVENKGLAVTLHYRQARETAGWAAEFASRTAAETRLVAHGGKASIELRPPIDADKGTVVEELAAGLAAVCFVGDDTGDLPAFAVLRRMGEAGVATLAVAVEGPETPADLIAAAGMVVAGPAGALAFLGELAGS